MHQTNSTGEAADAHCRRMYDEIRERAAKALDVFRAARIPDEVYRDTMSDIDVWAEDYRRRHGHYGIKETAWIEKSLTMKVFKLGRLQFERLEGTEADALRATAARGPETLVLNVHIQAGAPLDEARCEASYRAARPFYAARGLKFQAILFACHSWLLHPLLLEILPEDSNIIRFQRPYTIFSVHPENRQMEERVFGTRQDNPADYPEDTTLRRKLKEALLQGRQTGTAHGYFVRSDVEFPGVHLG